MKTLKKLSAFILISLFGVACSSDDVTINPKEVYPESLTVVSPPNPNVFPLLLAMKDYPELNIELIPVPGGSAVPTALQDGTAVATTIYSYIMANHVVSGAVPDLTFAAVTMWSNFYIVSHPGISSLSDLTGKKLIVSGPNGSGENGAPGKIIRAALKRVGLEPGMDLTVEYLPLDEGLETISSGNADAILLAEPAATGYIMKSYLEANDLQITVNLQSAFTGFEQWHSNELPLGGIGVVSSFLEEEAKKQQFDEVIEAYKSSAVKIMQGNINDLMVISEGLNTYFGFELPAPAILKSINEGRLKYKTDTAIEDIKTDLDKFIIEVLGESPGDSFYN
jgi:NitT/TauT family transport system substrate-binding protein